MNIVFDIETGADTDRAMKIMPAFDPNEVKCGNLGPEKAAAKIKEAESNHQSDWIDKAALRPETGRVIAIGTIDSDGKEILIHLNEVGSEDKVLSSFWDAFKKSQETTGAVWAGWNIFGFDLPFLILRSRILGVPVPPNLRNGRYFDNRKFIDLMDEWILGRMRGEVKASLGYVAQALGVGEKSGSGKDFAATYATNTAAALEYLSHDLTLTKAVGTKLGAL